VVPPDGPELVHALVAEQAAATPGAVALRLGDATLTYAELQAAANRLAWRLRALGVGPEATVAVALDRSFELVVALLGVLGAGAAYLPLERGLPRERLAFLLGDARPAAVVGTAGSLAALPLPAGLPVVAVDGDRDRDALAALPATAPPAAADPDNPAYVLYTSGSTGRPKGVVVPHRAVCNRLRWGQRAYRLTAADRLLQKTPAGFDVSVPEFFWPLMVGATMVLAPPGLHRDPAGICRLIADQAVTVVHFVPSMLELVAAEPGLAACGSVRLLLCSGEALPAALGRTVAASLPGARVQNMYGPTETTVEVSARPAVTDLPLPTVPLGRPIDNVRLHVVDAALRPVPDGEPGELLVGGLCLARGYLGRPGLTAERFVPDPFGPPGGRLYRTGDLVRRLPDGDLQFLGRDDGQVKVRGVRVELGEVEAAVAAHPAVARAAAAVHPGPGGARLVAYAVPADGRPPDPAALREHVAARLPAVMVPAAFVAVEALPLTANGKLDRRALPAPPPVAAGAPAGAPRTPTEALLAGIWAELLGVGGVGADDDLFALGAHSLLAARFLARVRQRLGVELDLQAVFEAPAVAALAARVAAAGHSAMPPVRHRDPRGPAPLSSAQQRLWLVDRLAPGNPAYNVPLGVRLRGPLDPELLDRALAAVLARHPALRSRFPSTDGRPLALTDPAGPVTLPRSDLRGLPPAERERALRELAEREAARPFELAAGPLWRGRLALLGPDEHALLLTIHHAVFDGWSSRLLLRDLGDCYRAAAGGPPAPAPPALTYADYAAWQREALAGEALAGGLAWWRERLAGAPTVLELPADHPRPPVQTHRGERHSLSLPPPLAGALLALCRREGVTLYVAMLAAFDVLLWRLTGERDLLVAAPVAGRPLAELEELVGFFVDTVVVRADLGGDPSFTELLGRVRAAVVGALAHQQVPFERLVQELRVPRDLARNPLVQVMLNLYSFEAPRLELPGVAAEPLPPATPGSLFDLTLYASEEGDGIRLDLVANPDLFSSASLRELLAQYRGLLEQVVAAPERPVGRLTLRTPGSRAVLPDPARQLPTIDGPAVTERFLAVAAADPGRPALAGEGAELSYGQLAAAAAATAGELVALGVRRGELVAVAGQRSPALVVALLGVLQAGAAFTVLDPAYPPARLAGQLRVAPPVALLEAGEAAPALDAHLRALPLRGRLRPRLDGAPGRSSGAPVPGSPDPSGRPAGVAPGDLAYVMFTSGSTGTPRAVAGSHGPLAHFLGWYQAAFRLGPDDRFAVLAGLAHDPLLRDVLAPLWAGASVHVPPPATYRAPAALLAWLAGRRVTVAHLTPQLARLLCEAAAPAGEPPAARLPALRLACCGGDTLTGRDVARLRALAPAATVVNCYGATETPQVVSSLVVGGDPPPAEVVPVGPGIDGMQLLVLGEHGQPAGVGELGEVWVRGPHLALGYHGDPELTAERFRGSGGERRYRTGDLGRHLPDGTIRLAGRRDEQVKVRGFRVELGDVEAALAAHPGVAAAAVAAHPEPGGELGLAAYLVPRPGVALAADELRRHARHLLPDHLLPSAWVTLQRLPLTPNGKLDRAALPAPARDRPELAAARVPPGDELEEAISAVWREVLGLRAVGVEDNFFELGGNSLAIVAVHARLRRRAGRELSVLDLFRYPTVRALAEHLRAADGGGPRLHRAARRVQARTRPRQPRPRHDHDRPEEGSAP
jgi:amino acid adenylation domain-containing protein